MPNTTTNVLACRNDAEQTIRILVGRYHHGAAAHLVHPGDLVIICAYVGLSQQELASYHPTLIYVDESNNITHTKTSIPVQAA